MGRNLCLLLILMGKSEKTFKENIRALKKIVSSRAGATELLERAVNSRGQPYACADYTAHDEIGLGGSDPQHYVWAAFSPKCGGRYRPNRGFRSRSFFSVEVRYSFFGEDLARALGERNAYF